jgi:hypothetical protein
MSGDTLYHEIRWNVRISGRTEEDWLKLQLPCHRAYTDVPPGPPSLRCVAVFISAVPLLPGSLPWLHASPIPA